MEIKKNKNGSTSYKEKVYLKNGQTKTKTFSRKTDAINWKRQFETEKLKHESLGISPLKENLPFSLIFNEWLKRKIEPNRSYKTIADYKSIGNKHLNPNFGSIKIRSIERSHADYLIQDLKSKGLKNKTANKVVALFKQVLLFAEIEGHLTKSPLRNFPMLKVTAGRIDYLTQQEIIQLLRANSKEEIYPLLVVALNTGMRIGELTGLCWDRLNFETNTIEVSRSLSRKGLKDSTKTNLVRHIPMNPEVKTVIEGQLRKQKSLKFVFTNGDGAPFNPDHFSKRHFEKALERAGVRKLNFHVLRHTFASQFMMNGGNIYDLQKILGHTKVDMTMIYAHLSPTHLQKVMETVRFSADGNKSVSPFLAPRENETQGLRMA